MGSKKSLRKHRTEDRTFTVLIEQGEDGFYIASVPSLRSCYTQSRTLEELSPRIRGDCALFGGRRTRSDGIHRRSGAPVE